MSAMNDGLEECRLSNKHPKKIRELLDFFFFYKARTGFETFLAGGLE